MRKMDGMQETNVHSAMGGMARVMCTAIPGSNAKEHDWSLGYKRGNNTCPANFTAAIEG